MTDLLIRHVTAVTVDAERRVIEDAAIAVTGDRVDAIGPDAETAAAHPSARVIDARDMAAIPGLIDCHSHAGHGLVRSLGAGDGQVWFDACAEIYARGSTVEFWRAEARLAQLERLKAGVTTAVSLLGGGADVYRTDDPAFGDAHCDATSESGLRTILAVGPGRRPFPLDYRHPEGSALSLSFARQLEVSEDLIRRRNDILQERTGVCLIMPVYHAAELAEHEAEIRAMSEAVADLRARLGALFTQDGHRDGTIAIARDLGLLGPFALLSHSVDLTEADFAALAETGAHIVHNPSAIMSVYGRCPAPELIEAGVTVCLGSDAGAPDRGFDMFRHMAQCMHYHRRHFRDPAYMPPGKVLEMATIDAARALGLEADLGSLEAGKKADIVLVDMRKPHLWPSNMPITRLAHFANAADVDTAIVDGQVLMQGRAPGRVDTGEIFEDAGHELNRALKRTGLEHTTREPDGYWTSTRRGTDRYPVR
ncbi:MAG: amidohydrolase family protein [Paracoccaceae bacterium]|nr:amidohydrolase family protein [Paracoccaceae bacterium]